jgi:hypothetical protein
MGASPTARGFNIRSNRCNNTSRDAAQKGITERRLLTAIPRMFSKPHEGCDAVSKRADAEDRRSERLDPG